MSRYSAGLAVATGVGTTLQPIFAVLATATVTPQIREIGIYNTTNVACSYEVVQITGGTPGATVTAYDNRQGGGAPAPATLCKGLWTVNGTVIPCGYGARLGAADGSSMVWAFGGDGLCCALGATVGIGVVLSSGTGQLLRWYVSWDE